jgi:hypothetical protein
MNTTPRKNILLRALLVMALAFSAFQSSTSYAAAPDSIPGVPAAVPHNSEDGAAIKACQECVTACERCAAACLNGEHAAKMAKCIALCRDCSDLCSLSAKHMARDSACAKKLCALCADVCQACTEQCAKHETVHCQQCAEACRKCADECKKMAK